MSELLQFIQDHEAAFKSQNRLASLYSDFSAQKTLNPEGYSSNLSAWKKALFHACRRGKIPAIAGDAVGQTRSDKSSRDEDARATDSLSFGTGEELGRALELRPYGRPTGLQEVIRDALERKEILPLKQFLEQDASIYSRRWVPTPWEVVRWGLRSMGLAMLYGDGNITVGRFAVIENVELAAKTVWERQRGLDRSPTSRVYSLRTFSHTFGDVLGEDSRLSDRDLQVLIRFMSRDRPSLSYDAATQTVRFAAGETSKPFPVDENDVAIAQVKTLALTLEQAIPPLEHRYGELDTRIREAIVKKQPSTAKSLLKARKLVDNALSQRRANLLQVEESLQAIETAATNVDIVSAMRESAKVMRDLNSRVGGVEGVERVTEALREEMVTADEIGSLMAEPGSADVDETEVDEELEELLGAERERKEAERKQAEEEEESKRAKEIEEKMTELRRWESKREEAREKQNETGDGAVDAGLGSTVEETQEQDRQPVEAAEETSTQQTRKSLEMLSI